MFFRQRWTHAKIVALRRLQHRGHGLANLAVADPGSPHHHANNVRIEHALHRDTFGSRLYPGDPADSIHQGFPVMRTSAPHQRSIDIEQHQGPVTHAETETIPRARLRSEPRPSGSEQQRLQFRPTHYPTMES